MHQQVFTDLEYRNCKRKTKCEEFLDSMEEIISWADWIREQVFDDITARLDAAGLRLCT